MIMTHIVYSLLTIGMNEYILILDFFYDDLALRDPHLCFKWGPRIIDLASFVCELNMTKFINNFYNFNNKFLLMFSWFGWFMVFIATFNNISVISWGVSFIGGGNQSIRGKPNFIT